MNINEPTPLPDSVARRRAKLLRLTGVIALVLGMIGAGVVYWLGTRAADADDSMTGFNQPVERQMGILYGKQGELIEDFTDDLKQPGTQAILIVVTTALFASGCFYFARLLDFDAEHPEES